MSYNTTTDATATPRTDAMLDGCEWGNRQDQAHTRLCRTLERELTSAQAALTASKAEIADLKTCLHNEYERAEKYLGERNRAEVKLRERTQWQCKCGGTDCAGQAENERLRADVERLKAADSFSKRELARGNEIIDGLRQERDQLRARVGELEQDKADLTQLLRNKLVEVQEQQQGGITT